MLYIRLQLSYYGTYQVSLLPHSSSDFVLCSVPLHYGIFDCSVGVGVFVTGLSQISSFFSYLRGNQLHDFI